MPANDDYQLLSLARLLAPTIRPDAHVTAQRTAKKQVIPGGDVQRWYFDVREMFFDRKRLPVIVVARMSQPIQKVRCDRRI